ncbi:MAG: FAD:protein FMN transferase [Candidatus Paceibacterota bacterium]
MSSKFSFDGIGTKWIININEDISKEKELLLLELIKKRIELFDSTYSRFRNDSWVSELSRKEGKYQLPPDAEELFSLYQDLYKISDGLVTPLIGETLVGAGYDAEYSFKQSNSLKTPPLWDEILDYAPPFLTIKKPTLLDLGAVGKGYLVDLVGKLLEENSIYSYVINAGGDILYKDNLGKNIRIGLEHPEDFKKVIGVVEIKNQSIAGSAGNRRKWGEFNHIINPKTLSSPKDILSVWVVAKKTILADGLATALFFVPAEILLKKFEFEYIIFKADHSIERSSFKNYMLELY